jgi:toxin ParE1/3/4
MPYNYQLSEEAESDVEEGYKWYESKRGGLGEEFLSSLDQAEEAIVNNPKTYRIRYKKKVRSFIVNRFPFMILYIVKGKNIDVISVFDTNQHPRKWKRRA